MSLRWKILVGYGVGLLAVALICAWAVVNLWRLSFAAERILKENYASILAADNMLAALERQDSAVLLLVLGFGPEGERQFRDGQAQVWQWLGRAKANVTIAGEAELLAGLEESYRAYLGSAAGLETAASAGGGALGGLYHEKLLPAFLAVRQRCESLRELNQVTMFAFSGQAQDLGRRAIWSTLLIGGGTVGLGLVFSLLLSDRLTRPLQEMIAATARIAAGDYDLSLSPPGRDELGRLAVDFKTMTAKLRAFHELNVERLVAEKRRGEAVIRSVSDGLLVVDKDYRVVGLNPAAAAALKVSGQDLAGRHVLEVVAERGLFQRLQTAMEVPEAQHANEPEPAIMSVPGEGASRHYQVSVTAARSEGGRLVGAVAVFQDVTRLKELDRLKSEFVLTASHELRTPLASMILGLGSLAETAAGKLNEAEGALLAAAGEEAQRLRALVDDLLDLSRLESGRLELARIPVSLAALARQALNVLAIQARDKGVTLASVVAEDLPPALGDPHKVTWVLTNLVGNALRYTSAGGRVEVGAKAGGEFLHVWVADDGAGIAPEQQARIFEKVAQIADGRPTGGSGLGLALCRELIKAMGGAIWVESSPGQGSTFTFTLPLAPAGAQQGGLT
ncbi:MAG: ATP-binding protein [Pseudomonadota bacterium]